MATSLLKAYWAAGLENFSFSKIYHVVFIAGIFLVILNVLNYVVTLRHYHRAHRLEGHVKGQLPPEYPFLIPSLGPLIQVWWDHGSFVRKLSSYAGRLTSNRISILGQSYYNFQDRDTIEKLFKQSALSSPIKLFVFATSRMLGMPKETMRIYEEDDSGPFPQPHPKSNVPHHRRIDYFTHQDLFRGLVGPGLHPTMLRFAKDVPRRLQDLNITEDWTEMSDFAQFFKDIIGGSTLQSIFGPTMFRLNPTFQRDMFAFDDMFPTFAPGFPRFMMPNAYRFRDRLAGQLKRWYKYARENFDESQIDDDGDGDPIWGSAMMRHRQETLLQVDKHGDEALARIDLGLSWATIGNVVLSSMFSAFHIFKDEDLLARVRHDLEQYLGQDSLRDTDPHQLAKDVPLLASVYAETLRLYIKVYSAYSSPHEDVDLGEWVLPKGAIAILNSEPSHMDPTFWNTHGGQYPVQSFWADRFLVDPSDPGSGPINPACRTPSPRVEKDEDGKPYFSLDGCEGTWIPYGGGHSVCPGRFFARNVIIFASAILAHEYDVELYSDSIEFTKRRYGFGVEEVKNALPFRIRKRARCE